MGPNLNDIFYKQNPFQVFRFSSEHIRFLFLNTVVPILGHKYFQGYKRNIKGVKPWFHNLQSVTRGFFSLGVRERKKVWNRYLTTLHIMSSDPDVFFLGLKDNISIDVASVFSYLFLHPRFKITGPFCTPKNLPWKTTCLSTSSTVYPSAPKSTPRPLSESTILSPKLWRRSRPNVTTSISASMFSLVQVLQKTCWTGWTSLRSFFNFYTGAGVSLSVDTNNKAASLSIQGEVIRIYKQALLSVQWSMYGKCIKQRGTR